MREYSLTILNDRQRARNANKKTTRVVMDLIEVEVQDKVIEEYYTDEHDYLTNVKTGKPTFWKERESWYKQIDRMDQGKKKPGLGLPCHYCGSSYCDNDC